MKKFLLSAVLGMCALTGFSQVKWDAKVGMSMSNITKMEGDMKVGYTFGVGMDYQFTDMWHLQSGLNFTSKGNKYVDDFSDEDGTIKSTTKVNPVYMEIPILAAAKFNLSDNMKFTVNAGPYLAFGLGGKAKTSVDLGGAYADYADEIYDEYGEGDYKLFSKEEGEEKAEMKRFDMGLQYGIGLEISDHYLINLTGQYGFTNPLNYDVLNEKEEKVSPKNLSFMISVGYRF